MRCAINLNDSNQHQILKINFCLGNKKQTSLNRWIPLKRQNEIKFVNEKDKRRIINSESKFERAVIERHDQCAYSHILLNFQVKRVFVCARFAARI